MEQIVLEKIHKYELEIAKEIKRICENNNIKYFLTAGTTLGAVRHGGFIPWDDDMDFGMLRSDYEKFVTVCGQELGKNFWLQTWDTDENFPFSYAKIRLKGTHLIEDFSAESKYVDNEQNGLFVDIFPYDSAPDNKIARKIQGVKYYILKRILWIKKGYGKNMKSNKKQALKYYAFVAFSKFFSYKMVKNRYKKILTKYNSETTLKIVTDGSYKYSKETIDRSLADNLEPIQFEGENFLTYKDTHKYLTHFYGNYMELPPVEKRDGHSVLNVDFGQYI